jgi:type II restriction/modification system DNA methylase subunit YeeA
MADFVIYWHEKARAMVEQGKAKRVGLLATQNIRGGASRTVLDRVKQSGDIFMAWSDEKWTVEGAAVHVSIVGFDDGAETIRVLNGLPVLSINSNLTSGVNVTGASRLSENEGVAFVADIKGGPFDITESQAEAMLNAPNPDGRSNRDVVRRWVNGADITRRGRGMWIIDFGVNTTMAEAALYELPFEYVKAHVKPMRDPNRRKRYRELWWLHLEPGAGMRAALQGLERYVVTPVNAKHRIFAWLDAGTLADHQLIAIARDDDYTFGVLHSRAHEVWALAKGTQLREIETGFRYTPTTTFETFPFPEPSENHRQAISEAAAKLDHLRSQWLNPPGQDPAVLKQRTLTNLYNAPPTWLRNLHAELDAAVAAAYGWSEDVSDQEVLEALLTLNFERSEAPSATKGTLTESSAFR